MHADRLGNVGPSARVLVLEDDTLNAMFIEDTLELAGHKVVGPAKTIPQALKLLASSKVDAALLDLQIDDTISYDVGRKLDELEIPWAITTAHAPSFVGSQFAHVPLLSKPFTITALLELIDGIVDGRGEKRLRQ